MKDKDTKILEEVYDEIGKKLDFNDYPDWQWDISYLPPEQLAKLPDHRLKKYFKKLQGIYHAQGGGAPVHPYNDHANFSLEQAYKKLEELFNNVKEELSRRGHLG